MVMDDITQTIICTVGDWAVVSGHVEYEINCQRALTGQKWTIKRRYRDFFFLNNKIQFFGLDLSLPPKKMFGNLKPTFIEDRKAGLQLFLDKITVHPLLYCSSLVYGFFANNGDAIIKELYQYSMLPLRNYRNYVLGEKLPDLGWRFCKIFSNVFHVSTKKQEIYVWMSYGADFCCSADEVLLILQFLRNLHCPYLSESNLTFADQNGIGVVKDFLSNGSLRDQLYKKHPTGDFWTKYGMDNECFVLNPVNVRFIARQILEALFIFNSIAYPFFFIHCGNVHITNLGCEIADFEFALTGQSCFNRPAMIRAKHVNTIEDMMVYNFGQLLYEMVSGVLVFPDHSAHQAIDSLPQEFQPMLRSIFLPESKLPSLAELISDKIFAEVPIVRMTQRSIQIPGAVKSSLEKLSSNILNRFLSDRMTFNEKQKQEHLEELMHCDFERQRRKELVLAQLKNSTVQVSNVQ
ncbi:hypothetical protein FO519_000703 [Halicephalobus sp. NKZ332]|nr:hypothetical protein FO519_000703 [Halicephalobus sp. NKZ332]